MLAHWTDCRCRACRTEPDAVMRFWFNVAKTDGCWEWQGSLDRKGYGRFVVNRRWAAAHRFSYELANGPIPKAEGHHGLCVCHRCDNRKCVRPDHLWLGTNHENVRDTVAKGRFLRKRCKKGHAMQGANVYTTPSGSSRCCRKCRDTRLAASYANRTQRASA